MFPSEDEEASSPITDEGTVSLPTDTEVITHTKDTGVRAALNLCIYYLEEPSRSEILWISRDPHEYRPGQYVRNDLRVTLEERDSVSIEVHCHVKIIGRRNCDTSSGYIAS